MCVFELDFEFKSKFAFEFLLTLERAFKVMKFSQVSYSEPQMGLKMTLWETRMEHLWESLKMTPQCYWHHSVLLVFAMVSEPPGPPRARCSTCCTSYSTIPPRHLRWLTRQLQLDYPSDRASAIIPAPPPAA